MKASEIREKWLQFFAEKNHRIEPSAPLVPHNDPSLLWINAGMAPLKPYFDGRLKPENPRIANVQKCIRTNDIENVGKTRRHHTFFEMLGNFSIGDYFKKEAIHWAWEFLTDPRWIGFDRDRLHVTIHPEDEEAFTIWHEEIGLPEERIVRIEDNFWDIGEGPCGPCTEIFYDRGEEFGDLTDPECYPGGENERFLEVWNLVFSQYNHNKDGSYTPLPSKNIDTGAGLERLASILQQVDSNFDTDLFQPIIHKTCQIAGVRYGSDEDADVALKVIADHIRTITFAIGDGVMPSNEGRGYVIRRLLRRAVRYGKTIGIHEPFLYRLVPVVGEIMGGHYKEVVQKQELIQQVTRSEEERFHETLNDGLALLEKITLDLKQQGGTQISGEDAFRLYDTYGFPLDLTEDYAREHGLTVDREQFEQEMEKQRERARQARSEGGGMNVQGGVLHDLKVKSEFVGYNELIVEAKVEAIIVKEELVDEVNEGTVCDIVLDRTPFYAESGGQVSDIGMIFSDTMEAEVEDVSRAPNGQHVHTVRIRSGSLRTGDRVTASVSRSTREDIVKNHTATHLLHKALKEVLGDHANQAGSLVAPDRLRFDFSHFERIEKPKLDEIERRVNEQIWLNTKLNIEYMPLEDAKAKGATALFGEKYGDIVRVVQIGDYSMELCGGCHVKQTGEIGLFKIVSESGIGSGIRRIEAVTGRHAYRYMEEKLALLDDAAALLKAKSDDVPKRIGTLLEQMRQSERELESLRARISRMEAESLIDQVKEVDGVRLLSARLDMDIDSLRKTVDDMKARLKSAIILLGSVRDNKVLFVAAVTPDLVEKGYHAGKIVKQAAAYCGGGGGGRPDMAQAGGKDPSKLNEALNQAENWIKIV